MRRFFDRILARPAVYNCLQRLGGLQHTQRRLRPLFEDLDGLTLLDVGEEQVEALFREMARVCRKRAIFLDAIDIPTSLASRLLWKYDRGSFPRRRERLHSLMTPSFHLIYEEAYTIYHSYVLWVGVPKTVLHNGSETPASYNR